MDERGIGRAVIFPWSALCLALGVGLIALGRELAARGDWVEPAAPALRLVLTEGWLLIAAAVGGALFALWRSGPATHSPAAVRDWVECHPYRMLFLISFVVLFVEAALIRYCAAQIRIFAFYKNVPLIACFLGLGAGCARAHGGPRQVMLFLLGWIPLSGFLSAGAIVVSGFLGRHGALGSSEQILGDFVPAADRAGATAESLWLSQLVTASFCVATFLVIAALFFLLGRLMGRSFEQVERLRGYSVNIVGSLCGVLLFGAVSYLQTPPWLWWALGLTPLLAWLPAGGRRPAVVLIALCVALVAPSYGDTVWSRYQKLIGHEVAHPGGAPESPAYRVEISDVFYQIAVDLSPETLARATLNPYPLYDAIYRRIPRPERVLIVGAGSGNDVAAALRAGAGRVDAVEIDPAILDMGREHHPERPYADPRVHVIVDDARHAFRKLPAGEYDAVLFALLDSHTQLGQSSVRLDNYVFTLESFREARRLLRPGGHLVVTAATFEPWLYTRLGHLLERALEGQVQVLHRGWWWTYYGQARDGAAALPPEPSDPAEPTLLPTDDWPFLYLPERGIPAAYLWVVGLLALTSIGFLRASGVRTSLAQLPHGHLFFLGAAFLLMEVHAINRLALLFGTTWLVSVLTITLVLLLIVAANTVAALLPRIGYRMAYAGLALSLVASYWTQPSWLLGRGTLAALGGAVVLLSPVFFAGLVFARSFSTSRLPAAAIGANILGAVVGGWVEYASMALGVRALLLLAALFYIGSGLLLWLDRRRAAAPAP